MHVVYHYAGITFMLLVLSPGASKPKDASPRTAQVPRVTTSPKDAQASPRERKGRKGKGKGLVKALRTWGRSQEPKVRTPQEPGTFHKLFTEKGVDNIAKTLYNKDNGGDAPVRCV